MRVILASASPRRRELLSQIINGFEVIPAKGEEKADLSLPPNKIAEILARQKCGEVFSAHGNLVIGCDTIVVFCGKVLGKPKDKEDARNTLKMLSGNTHSVITGVCVMYKDKILSGSDQTLVTFNTLTEEFIEDYIAGGSPMDKAGSYGIQDSGVVSCYKGSYSNVVGMPVHLVEKFIREVLKDDTVSN